MTLYLCPYLNFAGNAGEALRYYQEVFGGKLNIVTFGEYGVPGMPADGLMHGQLVTDVFTLMASDARPGAEQAWGGTRVYLAFMGDEVETLQGWYARLAADGTPGQMLERQTWGAIYGDVRDKFGVEWMFNITVPEGSTGNR